MNEVKSDILLSVKNLKTWFDTPEGTVRAVDGIDFDIVPGETLALLGESGCGKSISALSLLQLVPAPAGRIVSGRALLHDQDVLALSERDMRTIRGKRMAMIFQEPQTSLNPRIRIGEAIAEPALIHGFEARVPALLELVKLPKEYAKRWPHELSGGERQRVGIARALALDPKFLILDEPVSSLDVLIQVEILKLLKELKTRLNLTYLFIAHDLAVIGYMCDRIAVMKEGRIVEIGSRDEVLKAPKETYTRKLLESTLTS